MLYEFTFVSLIRYWRRSVIGDLTVPMCVLTLNVKRAIIITEKNLLPSIFHFLSRNI
mgnify:CR=1 FL=1